MRVYWKRFLSVLLSFIMAISLSGMEMPVFAADGTVKVKMTGTYGQTEARKMLSMINEFRTGDDAWYWNSDDKTKTTCTDLKELTYDYDLEQAAMLRAMEIALSFSHTRPNGNICFTAYSYSAAGENIAAGYSSAESVFEGWQETEDDYSGQGHRRNMLSANVTAVGFGHVYLDGYDYWVQEFRSPVGSTEVVAANDSKTTVDVEVLESQITSASIQSSTEQCSLNVGESAALPDVSVSIKTADTWPQREITVGTDVQWKSANTSCVVIDDHKLIGKQVGETTITATAFGKSVSIPVIVGDGTSLEQISLDTLKISAESYTYDGKEKCPDVIVTAKGKTLTKGTDYTVNYSNNKDAGTAAVTVTGIGNYKGTLTKNFTIKKAAQSITYTGSYSKKYGDSSFTLNVKLKKGNGKLTYSSSSSSIASVNSSGKVAIKNTGICTITVKAAATKNYNAKTIKITLKVKPKQANLKSLTAVKGKKLKVKWGQDKKATGYQIQYSTNKNFNNGVKSVTITKNDTLSKTLTKLTKGKKYYVRVRAYKTAKENGKNVKLYGSWSSSKQSGKIK